MTVPYEATGKLLRRDFNSFGGQCHIARILAHTAISISWTISLICTVYKDVITFNMNHHAI